MRILIAAVGSHGDVLPFIAIGAELLRRGHDVHLSAPEPFAAPAGRAGLRFTAVIGSKAYRQAASDPALWHPRTGWKPLFRLAGGLTRPVFEAVRRETVAGETVVVGSTLALGARLARDALAVPMATVHLPPMLMRTLHDMPRLPGGRLPPWTPLRLKARIVDWIDRNVLDAALAPPLNALRTELGLKPVGRIARWWDSPDLVVAMFPPWYAPPQPEWPAQTVQADFVPADAFGDTAVLPADLEAFLAAGAPPLVFSYASALPGTADFHGAAAALCTRLRHRGVILALDPTALPRALPPDVLAVPYAPLGALLSQSLALIHHGGIGTTALALAAGRPQLVVPAAFDNFDEAERVERLGVGLAVSRARFAAGGGARPLARLLASPAVAERCVAVAARFGPPGGAALAADAIEGLARRSGVPV